MSDSLREVLEEASRRVRGMSRADARDYASSLAAVGIGLLRGTAGEVFTRDFLRGALSDLGVPAEEYESPDNPHVSIRLASDSPTSGEGRDPR